MLPTTSSAMVAAMALGGRVRWGAVVFAVGLWLGSTLSAATVSAQTVQGGARLGGSAERIPIELSQTRFVSGTDLPDTNTTAAFRMRLFGEIRGRPVDRLGLTLGIDTGLVEMADNGVRLDRRPFGAQARNTLLLGNVAAELQLGRDGVVAVRVGRWQPLIGLGAVYDAYAFGAEIDVDLSLIDAGPVSFRARALLPDGTFTKLRKTSPLLDFQLSYRFGWQSRIDFLASVFFDTDDELADPLRAALFKGNGERFETLVDGLADAFRIDRDLVADAIETWVNNNIRVDTSGVVSWTGATARLGTDTVSLDLTVLGALGRLNVATEPTDSRVEIIANRRNPAATEAMIRNTYTTSRDVDVRAFFAEVQSRFKVGDTYELGSFALIYTGDQGIRLEDENPTLGAFFGLSPLLPRTAVFFGGTFGPDQATPTAFSLAPDSSGIMAAGTNVAAYWTSLILRVDTAVMASVVPSRFTGGQFYGFEVDLRAQIPLFETTEAFIDGGVLFPGDFFEDNAPALQFVAGIQLFAQSE